MAKKKSKTRVAPARPATPVAPPALPSLDLDPRKRVLLGVVGMVVAVVLFVVAASLGLPAVLATVALTLFMVSGIDVVLTTDKMRDDAR